MQVKQALPAPQDRLEAREDQGSADHRASPDPRDNLDAPVTPVLTVSGRPVSGVTGEVYITKQAHCWQFSFQKIQF